jgi:hypothetical protein
MMQYYVVATLMECPRLGLDNLSNEIRETLLPGNIV